MLFSFFFIPASFLVLFLIGLIWSYYDVNWIMSFFCSKFSNIFQLIQREKKKTFPIASRLFCTLINSKHSYLFSQYPDPCSLGFTICFPISRAPHVMFGLRVFAYVVPLPGMFFSQITLKLTSSVSLRLCSDGNSQRGFLWNPSPL